MKQLQCNLCPHNCFLSSNKNGSCGAIFNYKGTLRNRFEGYFHTICKEPIEKKPFRHFMPGSYTLSVGSGGCNLHCEFCQNFECSQVSNIPTEDIMTPEGIYTLSVSHDCPVICFTYNEPLLSYQFIKKVSEVRKNSRIKHKIICKTNGCFTDIVWHELRDVLDAVNIDWKGYPEIYRKVCGITIDRDTIISRVRWLKENNIHVEISIPVLNEIISNKEELQYFAQSISDIDNKIPIHLLTIDPAYKMKDIPTTSADIICEIMELFSQKGLKHIYKFE